MPPKRRNPQADSIAANPRAARTLAQLVATGAVKPEDKATKWYNHKQHAAVFAPVAPEKFRKRLKKLVEEKYGEAATKVSPAAKLRPKYTAAADVSFIDDEAGEGGDSFNHDDSDNYVAEVDGEAQFGAELVMPALQFKPLYVLSKWKHPKTKDNRVSVALLLPTGVGERGGDVKVQVEDGWFLRVDIVWPTALTDVSILMEMWLEGDGVPKIEEYHPQVQGFHDFLEQFKARQSDKIESYARVPLPFMVKPDFERHVLGWEGTAQIVLFVTLSAPERNFNPDDDKLVVKKVRRSGSGAAASSSVISD